MTGQSTKPHFTPATFRFLRALEKHNERAWFNTHKQEYLERVRAPLLDLIAELATPLKKISPHFVASPDPRGGSMFRIYRDIRFSKDKRPYKEWVSFKLYHERTRELHGGAPFFYLHVEPGHCFAAGGVWHPDRDQMASIRNYIVSNPASWKRITRSRAFRKRFELGGATLKRPPRGYDPDHELIEDIKRKDFVARCPLDDAELLQPDLARVLMHRYRSLAPLNDWLCGALDLEF